MSCSSSISLLLFLLSVRSVDSTHGFEIPEVDGFAVDDTCRMLPAPTPPPPTPTTATPPPVTRKILQQKVAATKKPVARSPPKKPIRRQPAPAGPIRSSHPNPAARLLYHLLTNSRGHAAASLPGFHRPVSQLMKRTLEERWRDGSSSSDSSDES